MQTVTCDGCGQTATPAHIAERIERLELATRYRPIHIQVLFLAGIAPLGIENDFYNSSRTDGLGETEGNTRRRRFFEALGIPCGAKDNTEESLGEFQRRGYYLAFAVECPQEMGGDAGSVVARMAPNVLKRIQFSYKPKFIILLDSTTQPLIRALQDTGFGSRLLLSEGVPVSWPLAGGLSSSGKPNDALRLLLGEIQKITTTV